MPGWVPESPKEIVATTQGAVITIDYQDGGRGNVAKFAFNVWNQSNSVPAYLTWDNYAARVWQIPPRARVRFEDARYCGVVWKLQTDTSTATCQVVVERIGSP